MIESKVASKYATALFRTAKRSDQVKRVSHDLLVISDLVEKNPLLRDFLESPQVPEKDKKELIGSTFRLTISEALFSFLMLVISKHRMEYLSPMAEEFQRLVKQDQGIVETRLVTARSVDRSLVDQIRQEMERNTGKKLEVKLEVDARLIGGIVVVMGDKVIDRSIRYQLNQLKEQMSALKVH